MQTDVEPGVNILDPSDKFRPEKPEEQFRNFTESCEFYNRVKRTYYVMHTNQTFEFAKSKVSSHIHKHTHEGRASSHNLVQWNFLYNLNKMLKLNILHALVLII